MSNNDYHFITCWRIEGAVTDIADVLKNAEDLPRWWPSVYLDVRELEPGGQDGIGKVVSLHTRGWLPYTLRWQFRVIESRYPHGYTLEAWGDFNGRGIWTFEQEGELVNVTYDWRVRADKPLLKMFSFLFKPVFSANHRWAMARGEESLRVEVDRLREKTERTRAVGVTQDPGVR
jgi:hypothetical protein